MDVQQRLADTRYAKFRSKNKIHTGKFQLKGSIFFWLFLLLIIINSDITLAQSDSMVESPRMLTLRGNVDPRLSVWARTTYSPTNYRTDIDDGSGCTHNRSDTGYRKAWPDWEVVKITPNENNRYEITIPIDYMGENKCGYRYHSTKISIRRDEDDERYAKIVVVSDSPRPFNIHKGTKGGHSSLGLLRGEHTDKPHYQMSTGSKISCYTEYYENEWLRKRKANVVFTCEPVVASDENGVDEINSVTLEIDIEVDESRCLGTPDSNNRAKDWKRYQDYFRDYQPEPTRWEKLKQFFN